MLGHDVEGPAPPRDDAADLEHRLSDDEPVALKDLWPYDERDVAKLVLQGDEDGVGAGVLPADDQPGDGDLGAVLKARYVLAGRDLFGKALSHVGHEVTVGVDRHCAVFAQHGLPIGHHWKPGHVLLYRKWERLLVPNGPVEESGLP